MRVKRFDGNGRVSVDVTGHQDCGVWLPVGVRGGVDVCLVLDQGAILELVVLLARHVDLPGVSRGELPWPIEEALESVGALELALRERREADQTPEVMPRAVQD